MRDAKRKKDCAKVRDSLRGEYGFTKYGFMHNACKRIFDHGVWKEFSSQEIPGAPGLWPRWESVISSSSGSPLDMPLDILYGTPTATVAILEWQGLRPAVLKEPPAP